MKKFKIFTVVILCLCVIMTSTSCSINKNTIKCLDYLETATNVITHVDEYTINTVGTELEKYYTDKNNFSELNLNLSDNVFCIYYLFYDYMLLDGINYSCTIIEDNINYLVTATKNATQNDNINVLDLVACICLNKMINGKCDVYLFNYLNNKFYNSEKGVFENNSAAIDSDIALTIDICNMFKASGIDFDEKIKKTVKKYYTNYNFASYSDKLDIYSAGGEALYAMHVVNNEVNINKRINEWYFEWKKYYNLSLLDSWEDVMNINCIFRPVAESMNDTNDYSRLNDFVLETKNIEDLFAYFFEERLIYDLLKYHLDILTDEEKRFIGENIFYSVKEHLDDLKKCSIKATFYGTMLSCLSQNLSKNYNYKDIIYSIEQEYMDLYKKYINSTESSIIDKAIEDTYYYLIFMLQKNEGVYSKEITKKLEPIVENLLKNINTITEPQKLRMLCTILSQLNVKLSIKEYNSIKTLVETFLENEIILNSYYIIDVYMVDNSMGLGTLTIDKVKTTLNKLNSNGCYLNWNGEKSNLSLESTFYVYSFFSLMGLNGFQEVKYDSTKKELIKLFRNPSGKYNVEYNKDIVTLETMYWGVCLNNL